MVTNKDAKLSEFTATKSKEMQGLLDGIFRYLDELGVSPESVGRFKESLQTAAQKGEQHQVFELMCHASEQSVKRATEMEAMRIEYEEMKKKVIGGGQFGSEEARMSGTKRGNEEISKGGDIWDEFESMMKQENGKTLK
eukprot:3821389-Rhodomonas_salina.1